MIFTSDDRVFIDESKSRGYIVAATAASPASIHGSEKALRSLLKSGQRRLHFKSERDSRHKEILYRMCELDLRAAVWIAKGLSDKEARPLCFTSLTAELLDSQVESLYIERDDSLIAADKRIIAEILRKRRPRAFKYSHVIPREQPLLWVSDAVAWSYSNGGDWLRRTAPLIGERVFRL